MFWWSVKKEYKTKSDKANFLQTFNKIEVFVKILKTFLIGAFAVSACLAQGSTGSTTVKDADGNIYTSVKIGDQVWTVENLRTTKYNDGTAIPVVKDSAAWVALKTPGYCYYNNTTNAGSIKKYGALYNWYVVNTGKLAPEGWHVPTDSEWTNMENYLVLNGYNWDGTKDTAEDNKIAKSLAAKTDWSTHTTAGIIGNDLTKNNSSGFRPFRAVVVMKVCSAIRVTTVTGGALRRNIYPLHGTVTSYASTATLAGTPTSKVAVIQFG